MAPKAHAERLPGRGWLKNGNPPGNPGNAPRCGARTRAGTPCKAAAMPNGRCRMHGGPSTGPKTEAGKAKIRASRTKHGRKSQAAIQQRREGRATLRLLRELLAAELLAARGIGCDLSLGSSVGSG
jgi:hypothetical protein